MLYSISSSLQPRGEEHLEAGLAAAVLGLALLDGLHLGAVLDGLAVGKLGSPDKSVEVLRLERLDGAEVLGSGELSRGDLTQEPPDTLLVL